MPITLDSLTTLTEDIFVKSKGYLSLKDQSYSSLRECRCSPFFNRLRMDFSEYDEFQLPKSFKNPFEFFDAISCRYITNNFSNETEINIVSVGSDCLLHELIINSKLIKELAHVNSQNTSYTLPKINLHAIDQFYKKPADTTSDFFNKTAPMEAISQFKKLVTHLGVNVSLLTYDSIGQYEEQIKKIPTQSPHVILAIDFDHIFKNGFPKPEDKTIYPKNTQEHLLSTTKYLARENALYLTLTHLDCNKGIFVLIDQKLSGKWKEEWKYSIFVQIIPLTLQYIISLVSIRKSKNRSYKFVGSPWDHLPTTRDNSRQRLILPVPSTY